MWKIVLLSGKSISNFPLLKEAKKKSRENCLNDKRKIFLLIFVIFHFFPLLWSVSGEENCFCICEKVLYENEFLKNYKIQKKSSLCNQTVLFLFYIFMEHLHGEHFCICIKLTPEGNIVKKLFSRQKTTVNVLENCWEKKSGENFCGTAGKFRMNSS